MPQLDDIKDFYHAHNVSEATAMSSPVGPSYRANTRMHLKEGASILAKGLLAV